MYSISAVTVSAAKAWTAAQRRVLVAAINRADNLFQPVELGNTRKRVCSYTVVFKTLAAAEAFSRTFGYAEVSAAERCLMSR